MSNRIIKLVPYSKELFPLVKTINKIPVEDATKKYLTVKVFTDELGKPVRTGEDYFIDEQGNPLKPKELQEVVISAPAHLSDEEYRLYLLNSQNFNRRYGLPIDYDNIPLFTYNGITGKRDVDRNTYERYIAADNKSRAFNKLMDAMLAGTTAMIASPYLLGGASAIPFHYLAPGTTVGNFIGDAAGSMAGIELANLASERFTGKTVDLHINRALDVDDNSFTGQWITPMLNPAGYATMAFSPVINASKTAVSEFTDNLAKQYINQTNPGLIKKTLRTFLNGLDRAKQTMYNLWGKFTKIPEIELLTKYPKVIFDKTKFTSNDPNVNPIVKEIEHTKHLRDKGKEILWNLNERDLGNDFYGKLSLELGDYIEDLRSTFSNPFSMRQSFYTDIPQDRLYKFIRSVSSDPYIESKSIVYNPFTGTNVPIKQKLAIGRNSNQYTNLYFDIIFPTRPELLGTISSALMADIPAKKLLTALEKVIPIIENINGKGRTIVEFTPIQTTEGDLQKGALEIKTSIENIIGDEGLVAGSVYKLSNGHFLGSNLSHNPNSAPHDIEIWTYSKEAADAIAEKLGLEHTGDGGITRKYKHPNGTEFEIAFIDRNQLTGNARGDLAWQLFETYNPDEALALKRKYLFESKPYLEMDLTITPEALYQIYLKNPELMDRRTVLDTITAASDSTGVNGLPNKQKHSDRTTQMLMDPLNVERMDDAISHLYKLIWGTAEGEKKLPSKVYHAIDYNDVEANKFFLEKLGFSKEVAEKMATNPQLVQNVFNYWYLLKMCGKRFGKFSAEKKTEENALQVLSTNVSPNGEYGSGGGGNSSTSPVWTWPSRNDFTGLIYNPLTYKPETITNLQKVIEKYELQRNIDDNILKFTRNLGESLDDYIKRVAQQSQDLDMPVTVGDEDYLGRFSMPKKEDVGQLLSGESVRVGGAFNQQGVRPTIAPIDFLGVPNAGNPNLYNFEDMLKYPEEFKEIIELASLGNPIIKEALKTAEKEHISVTEAINIKYTEFLLQKAKLESEIDKIKKSEAYTKGYKIREFQREQIKLRLKKLESKLETLKKLQDQYASASRRIEEIVNTGGIFMGLAGGVGAGIYGVLKYSKEEYDSEYMQQLILKTPQQALVQLEIDKENALNKCKSLEQKSKIEKYYNEIKSKLINYYSKESNAKIINESSPRQMKDASIALAVQNARKKYRLGGILKYKWYK